jgi:hypothetical protein
MHMSNKEDNDNKIIKKENTELIISDNNLVLLHYPDISIQELKKTIRAEETQKVILAATNCLKIKNTDISYSTYKVSGKYKCSDGFKRLANIIIKTIWDSGFNYPESEQEALVPALIQEIKDEFGYLSIEEVEIAFKKGCRNYYGDFFGINIKTVHQWLNTYIETTKVDSMVQLNLVKKLDSKPKEVTLEHKIYWSNVWLKSVIDEYNKFLETDVYSYYDAGNILFNFLERNNLFKLNSNDKNNIFKKAKEEYKKEKSPSKATKYADRVDFARSLERLANDDENEIERVKMKARQMAIHTIFHRAKKKKLDFIKIISEALEKEHKKMKNQNKNKNNG